MQTLVIARQLFPQRRQSRVLGVVGVAVGHGLAGGFLDELGRGKIGLAKVELEHALHPHGDFCQLADAGRGDG